MALTKVTGPGIVTTTNLRVGILTADTISVGGTITYEDVTEINSVGVVTAQSGLHVGAAGTILNILSSTGISTFGGVVNIETDDNNAFNIIDTTASFRPSINFKKNDSGTVSTLMQIRAEGTDGLDIKDGSGNLRLRIDSSGRLLLGGTTTEGNAGSDDLTIATSGSTGITLRSGTSSNGNLYFSDGTSGDDEYRGSIQYQHASNKLIFATNAVERLTIDTDGFTGIGTNFAPKKPLNVLSGIGHTELIRLSEPVDASIQQNFGIGWCSNNDHTWPGAQITSLEFDVSDTRRSMLFYTRGTNQDIAPTERMRIASDGKIGIGTASPSRLIHGYETTTNTLLFLESGDTNVDIVQADQGGSTRIRNSQGSLIIYVNGDASSDNATNAVSGLTIDPDQDVHVHDDLFIPDKIVHEGDTNTAIRFPSNDTIHLETAGANTERLCVTGIGSVGIGTSGPDSLFHIFGSSGTQKLLTLNGGTTKRNNYIGISGSDNLEIAADEDDEGGDSSIRFRIDGAEKVRIKDDGAVGINTTTPGNMLQIASPSGHDVDILRITSRTGSLAFSCADEQAANPEWRIRTFSSEPLAFRQATTERMRIDSGGQVCIGGTSSVTVASASPLQVQGSSSATGLSIIRTAAAGGQFQFAAGSSGTNVDDDDSLGHIKFFGFHTNGYDEYSRISAEVDGTNGDGDAPGSLVFLTTADGAGSPTEKMRLAPNGALRIGDNTNADFSISNDINAKLQLTAAAAPKIVLTRNDTSVVDEDYLGMIDFHSRDGGPVRCARIGAKASGSHASNDHPTDLVFHTCQDGTNANDEKMRLDQAGRLLVGTTVAMSTGSNDIRDTIQAVAPSGAQLLLARNDTGTVNTNRLGEIAALCNDQSGGNNYEVGASIRFEADASQGDGDKPTAIVFKTCVNASNTLEERARFTSGGALRIDKTSNDTTNTGLVFNPTSQSFMGAESSWVLEMNRETNDGHLLRFTQDNSLKGQISVSGSDITYGEFLGVHRGRFSDGSKPTILRGTIVDTINHSVEWKTATVGAGNTILIPYYGSVSPGGTDTVTYNSVSYTSTIGICTELHTPAGQLNKHTGYKISDTAGSKAVGGVFVTWDDHDIPEGMSEPYNDFDVGALGDYFIRMKAGETVAIGDLVESNGDGTGKVQSDDIIRSKTVGKITMTNVIKTYDDGSFLVTAVLYCG